MTNHVIDFPQREKPHTSEQIITRETLAEWLGDIPTLHHSVDNVVPFPKTSKSRIGVFCDTRMYSAFLQKELSRLPVAIHCLLYPSERHLSRSRYLQRADAWILCLTEDESKHEAFLDTFLSFCSDTDVLCIFSKASRTAMSEKIRHFILDGME